MFLPIKYKTHFTQQELGELNTEDIFDLLEIHLDYIGMHYVERKKDKIIFHKADGHFLLPKYRDFLMSGEIRIESSNNEITVINGNWLVFTWPIPTLILIVLAYSKWSAIPSDEIQVLWGITASLFLPNLFLRIIAHKELKNRIHQIKDFKE